MLFLTLPKYDPSCFEEPCFTVSISLTSHKQVPQTVASAENVGIFPVVMVYSCPHNLKKTSSEYSLCNAVIAY